MSIDTGKESALQPSRIAQMRAKTAGDRHLRSMMNAVTKSGLQKVALNRDAFLATRDAFSQELASPSVTNQMKSGRCWMFAGLNVLRRSALDALKVEEFELSQNYLTFFEKLEKANGYLDDILSSLHEPKDSRLVSWLLGTPVEDGGEWELFANLVLKYGVVPAWKMPETHHSSDSRTMNHVLNLKLREGGLRLRGAHAAGAGHAELAQRKEDILDEAYRILTVFLGAPPASFDFEYRDKEQNFHRDPGLTPQEFFARYISFAFDEYASVVNVPTPEKPFGRTYIVSHLPVVRGGPARPYLNVDVETMRALALAQLQGGESVYFGCDVVQMMDAEAGVLDSELYDLEGVFGIPFGLTKAERLDYGGEIAGGHQMVFAGVHVVDGAPRRWKVENSWGAESGKKGYFAMSDGWFSEYVYQVVVRRELLPKELQSALESPPIVLPPWDPMRGL